MPRVHLSIFGVLVLISGLLLACEAGETSGNPDGDNDVESADLDQTPLDGDEPEMDPPDGDKSEADFDESDVETTPDGDEEADQDTEMDMDTDPECEEMELGCVGFCEDNVAINCIGGTDAQGCSTQQWTYDDCGEKQCRENESDWTQVSCEFYDPGLTWVGIPAGSYQMGGLPDDNGFPNEHPRHGVSVSFFEMLETEVTQAQYLTVIRNNPSQFFTCPDCPVEQVSWFQAKAFCERVGGRLPSEAEWEYAARAGSSSLYPCGDNVSCLGDQAWFDFNSEGQSHPVAMKAPNDFGLYDMVGSVFEWVEDCWHETYDNAPTTGIVWRRDEDCTLRVLRGGSWYNMEWYLRPSFRGFVGPTCFDNTGGFRCARDSESMREIE